MSKNKKKNARCHQGFLLAITLTDDKLVYSLCRLIPLSWIRLAEVDCMRASFFQDIFPRRKEAHRIVRNRYWVSTIHGVDRRTAPLYVIETRKKHRRVFLRIESSFHYQVRSALGHIKSIKNFD